MLYLSVLSFKSFYDVFPASYPYFYTDLKIKQEKMMMLKKTLAFITPKLVQKKSQPTIVRFRPRILIS